MFRYKNILGLRSEYREQPAERNNLSEFLFEERIAMKPGQDVLFTSLEVVLMRKWAISPMM